MLFENNLLIITSLWFKIFVEEYVCSIKYISNNLKGYIMAKELNTPKKFNKLFFLRDHWQYQAGWWNTNQS